MKKKIELIIQLITILVLGFLLSGCDVVGISKSPTPTPVPIDLRNDCWYSGEPCFPPCWNGLIIGVSTEEDVISTISNLPFVITSEMDKEISGYSDALTGEYYDATTIWAPIIGDAGIRFRIVNDVLNHITIWLNFEISIDEIVTSRGIPDYVTMRPDFNNNYCDVGIYWLEDQFITISRVEGDGWKDKCMSILGGGRIDRNMRVTGVAFTNENSLIAIIDRGDGSNWPGFIE